MLTRITVLTAFLTAASLAADSADKRLTVKATAHEVHLHWFERKPVIVERKLANGAFHQLGIAQDGEFTDASIDPALTYTYRATPIDAQTPATAVTVGPPPAGFNAAVLNPNHTNSNTSGNFGQYTCMVLDENGDPMLAYVWVNPSGNTNLNPPNSDTSIYFVSWNRSTNSFNTPVKIAVTGDIESGSLYFDFYYPLALSRDPVTNTLGLAYRSYSANGNTAYVNIAFSNDNGQTWASQQLISQAVSTNDYCCIDLALYNGAVYETYYIGSSGPLELATGTETTPASTWTVQHSYQVTGYPGVVNRYCMAVDSTGDPAVVITRVPGGSGALPTYFWRPLANTAVQVLTDNGDSATYQSGDYDCRLAFFGTQPRILYGGQRNANPNQNQNEWLAYSTTGAAGSWTVTNVPANGGATDGDYIAAPFGIAVGSLDQLTVVSTAAGGSGAGCGDQSSTNIAYTTNFSTWTICDLGGATGPDITSVYPVVRYGVNDGLFLAFQEPDVGDALAGGVYVWTQYVNGPCTYNLTAASQIVPASAASYSLVLNAPAGCSWVAQSNTSWITLTSGNSGSGTTSIAFNVAANTGNTVLTGTITVAGITYTVTQLSTACSASLNPTSATFAAGAQTASVGLTTGTGCPWTASSGASWLTITSAASGTGSTTVNYSVAANTGAQRSGSLTLGGVNFPVTQSGPVSCTYTLASNTANLTSAAQTGSVGLTTGSTCAWTAASQASWITVTSAASGTGPATVNYSIAANTSTSSRSGTIAIGGQTYTVNQAGASGSCTYSLSASGASFSAAAAAGSVNVTAPSGCPWTAASNNSWIVITSGASGLGNGTVAYSVAQNASVQQFGSLTIAGLTYSIEQAAPPMQLVPVTPCRVADTRNATGPFGGPIMSAGSTRTFNVPQSACNIPANALAYSLNVTVVPPAPLTYLSIWPAGQAQPVVSTLNSFNGSIVANAAIVPAGTNGGIDVFVSDATHVIIDINGYFVATGSSGAYSFYPVTPCRVADTRNATAPLGGPLMSSGSTRTFPITSSACGLPATAQAYSFNITVVPHQSLNYLTIWPTGQTQPYVSTLNSPAGSIVANAAIVPAGSGGGVSIFVTDNTDVIIDVNGYFAAPGASGALSFYTLTPCRVTDTRNAAGPFGGPIMSSGSTRGFAVPASSCAVPSTAQAYSLNVTVIPSAALGYLTIWPTGVTQPYVSTLNSPLGQVVANAAIVPAGQSGGVSVFVTDSTQLILDIDGYFAQ